MSEKNKEIVDRFVEAGNSGELDALDEILTPNIVRHCQATLEVEVTNRTQFKKFYQDTVTTFPDQRVTIDTMVAEGDRVLFWGQFAGTQEGPWVRFP